MKMSDFATHRKSSEASPEDLKRHGKHLLLYSLSGVGAFIFFGLGWAVFPKDPRLSNVLIIDLRK